MGGSGGSGGGAAAAEQSGASDAKERAAGSEGEGTAVAPAAALPNIKRQLSAFAVSAPMRLGALWRAGAGSLLRRSPVAGSRVAISMTDEVLRARHGVGWARITCHLSSTCFSLPPQ